MVILASIHLGALEGPGLHSDGEVLSNDRRIIPSTSLDAALYRPPCPVPPAQSSC